MPGGNPPKPPHSSNPHHRKHRFEPSSSSASASASASSAADHKPSGAAPKSKPSPKPTSTPPNNRDASKTPPAKPKPGPENPSHRPDNPITISGPRPIFPFADPPPPPPPSYGFHMLDRRTIVLADGSVRSYFALPPDYENFNRMPRPGMRPELRDPREFGLDRPQFPMGLGFLGPDARTRNPEYWHLVPENSLKRKFGEDEREGRSDGFERQRQQLLQYGNANGPGPSGGYNPGRSEEMRAPKNMRILEGNVGKLKHSEVDQSVLMKAFLHFAKLVFETANQKKSYLADGKQGPVSCLACSRSGPDLWLRLLKFLIRYLHCFCCFFVLAVCGGKFA